MTETPETAEQRGFIKGFGVGLLTLAIPCALWGVYRALVEFPRFEGVFRQVKVPMPGLFLIIMNTRLVMAGLLVAAVIGCSLATRLGRNPRTVLRVNLAFLLVSVGWLGLVTLAVQGPLLTVLDVLGGPR